MELDNSLVDVSTLEELSGAVAAMSDEELKQALLGMRTTTYKQKARQRANKDKIRAANQKRMARQKLLIEKAKALGIFEEIEARAKRAADAAVDDEEAGQPETETETE